jgi:hypothetical protein
LARRLGHAAGNPGFAVLQCISWSKPTFGGVNMAIRHFFQVLRFFEEAWTYSCTDDADVHEAGVDGTRHASFHRRIVSVGVPFGVVGAGLGIAFLLASGGQAAPRDGAKVLLAPLMFAASGLIFGVAVACLFAPRAFLTGPVGRRWMQLIGTRNVIVARVVCSIFTLLLLGIICLFILAAWLDMQRRPG